MGIPLWSGKPVDKLIIIKSIYFIVLEGKFSEPLFAIHFRWLIIVFFCGYKINSVFDGFMVPHNANKLFISSYCTANLSKNLIDEFIHAIWSASV